jgi:NTP pyrophosphatase (non-canonical NTP hydrolase)
MNDKEIAEYLSPNPHASCPACGDDCQSWIVDGKPCRKTVPMGINELCIEAHQTAIDKGWYEEPVSFPAAIALMHSELSEALEEYRVGNMHFRSIHWRGGKPCGIPIELADVCIRIFDTCAYLGIDLEKAIETKMIFNNGRPVRHGGKLI